MKKLFYLAGLPRSGSTVLSALLKQHPEIYVSPTSPLLNLLMGVEKLWRELDQSFTMTAPDRLESVSLFMMHGYYDSLEETYIFDKSRGWPTHIASLERISIEPVRVVTTVRDIPSILASFHRLFQWGTQNPNYIETALIQRGQSNSNLNRCQILWESMVQGPWNNLKMGLTQHRESLLLVDYERLLAHPRSELERIYDFCEIPQFKNDFANISTEKEEIDEKWGIEGLHNIGSELKRQSPLAEQIIGAEAFAHFKKLDLEFWKHLETEAQ